jgi:serine O-acetyltransferase
MMKNLRSDLKRYKKGRFLDLSEPSIWIIILFRMGRSIRGIRFAPLRIFINIFFLPVYYFSSVFIGITIPRGCRIGPGLRIYHFGGIVFNPDTVIGSHCTLRHGVTIGNRKEEHDVPVIGNYADIGAGAKILGRIVIGDHVSIGANAVVLTDVPDHHMAVGVPARVIPKK